MLNILHALSFIILANSLNLDIFIFTFFFKYFLSFNVFIEFVTILFLFFMFQIFGHEACVILSSLTKDRTRIALEMNPKISEGVYVSEEEEKTERLERGG